MELQVWLDGQPAAVLETPGSSASPDAHPRLRYLPAWTTTLRAYPLSPRLPLGGPAPDTLPAPEEAHWFLRHLLPAGAAERGLAQARGVGAEEPWSLLAAAGDDLPGAMALRRTDGAGREPRWVQQSRITPEALAERLSASEADWLLLDPRGEQVLPWWPAGGHACWGQRRRPLLGVYLDQGHWWWTRTPELASTHLLDMYAPGGEALAANRLFCLRLAARLGVLVAPVTLHRGPMPVLQFQRLDRLRLDDGRVRRLHAVSAGQALGLQAGAPLEPHAAPPMGDDVPPWGRLGALLSLSPQPLVDRRALMRWWIFQSLIGQADASPDDLWFRLDHSGLRLAPAMNFWCPAAACGSDMPQASASVGAMLPRCTSASDWARAANVSGVKPRSLANELRRMCEAAPGEARALAGELGEELPSRVCLAIEQVVSAQALRHLAWVEDLLRWQSREV